MPKQPDYEKYQQIMVLELDGRYSHSDITTRLHCSYGTIQRAKEWYHHLGAPHQEEIKEIVKRNMKENFHNFDNKFFNDNSSGDSSSNSSSDSSSRNSSSSKLMKKSISKIDEVDQEEIEFLKRLIIRSTHRRIIKQEESKKALDILYKIKR